MKRLLGEAWFSLALPRRAAPRALLAATAWGLTLSAQASGIEQLRSFVAQVHAARGAFAQREIKAPPKGAQAAQAGRPPTMSAGTSSGIFVFARPGKFIWSYEKPYEQVLQADGQHLYIYDKDLNQVTERPLGASPAAILFGSNNLEKNCVLRDVGIKDGVDTVELVPKARDTQFQRITIGFHGGELQTMTLYDVFGNVTMLTFSELQKNPSLKAGAFHFDVPRGADVITG